MDNILVVGLYPTEACPTFTFQFCLSLKKQGYNVHAILPNDIVNIQEWESNFNDENLIFLNITKRKGILGKIDKFINPAKFIFNKPKLFKNISKIKFSYIFFTFHHSWNSLLFGIKSNVKIMFVHDPIPHSDENKKKLLNQRKQIKCMDKLIVLSKKFIDVTSKMYNFNKENIYFMPHCLMNYSDHSCNYQLNENLKIRFLFFGRLVKYKGLEYLIEAYEKLEKEDNNVELVIAGNGSFDTYWQSFSMLKNKNLINRYIAESEIEEIFCKPNTVCVLPYTDATQSGVVSIAFEYKIPTIVSDTGGLKEQLNDGRIGIYCKPSDSETLYQCLKKCRDFSLLKEQSNLMNDYAKYLSWDNQVAILMDRLIRK